MKRPRRAAAAGAGSQRGRAFDLVAFDLYGTLLDIAGLAARMRPVAGEESATLLGRWRKAQLERTWRLNLGGRYERWIMFWRPFAGRR